MNHACAMRALGIPMEPVASEMLSAANDFLSEVSSFTFHGNKFSFICSTCSTPQSFCGAAQTSALHRSQAIVSFNGWNTAWAVPHMTYFKAKVYASLISQKFFDAFRPISLKHLFSSTS